MKTISGKASSPIILIHGGAYMQAPQPEAKRAAAEKLRDIAQGLQALLVAGQPAVDLAQIAVERLEAEPLFNAGRGAMLQSDGVARLSASIMDGDCGKFSAVNLVTDVLHPVRLARELQNRKYTVLGPQGAQRLARELSLPLENLVTEAQLKLWLEEKNAEVQNPIPATRGDTVGAVVLDAKSRLAASTSTGGVPFAPVERMSDCTTVAGNYATKYAGISCTGRGEDIVNLAVAARIEARVRDGASLQVANDKMLAEAAEMSALFGWIALSSSGDWVLSTSTVDMEAVAVTTGGIVAL